MELVAAALGSDLNLCATEAATLGVIAVGDNLHAFNGLFRRSNDCSPAPDGAGGADTVDRNAVVLIPPAMGQRLRPVFRLKNALAAPRRSGALRAGNIF